MEQLIDTAKSYPQVKKIIIFGSSIKERCTPFSDVDALFVGEPVLFYSPRNGQAYDILWEKNLPPDAEILKTIAQEGVVVYER